MRRGPKGRFKSIDLQVPLQVGDSKCGETRRRESSPPSGLLVKEDGKVHGLLLLGLPDREARKLSEGEEHSEGRKVRHKRQRLHLSSNRADHVVKLTCDEERSNVRTSSILIKGGKDSGGDRRHMPRHDSKKLSKTSKVSKVLDFEKEEECCTTTESMDSNSDSESGSGFSDSWSLAEQEPPWYSETFQKQTALGVGEFQSWEDLLSDETPVYPSDLLDADGCSSSG